jgi:chorismate synthase
MSGNLFGNAYRVLTFGESHGKYIGLVIDGLKPGLEISVDQIQQELNRRRPGQSSVTTPRQEKDRVEVVSGILEGKTTGTPVCMLIANEDQRSGDYRSLEKILRPGHAGYSFLLKYGIFDFRGGGRASGRETATRVAAGAVAKQLLEKQGIRIQGYTRQIGNIKINTVDPSFIEKNPLRTPDPIAAKKMQAAIEQIQKEGDSLGGIIEILVKNCPAGLGEPVFQKLEADLAGALMSIGAVKGFEIGTGFKAATMKGSEQNDSFYYDENEKRFRTKTNNAGGTLGGISNGEDLIMRIAVKPPSSINKKMETVDWERNLVSYQTGGRHDPCICPRVVPVAEAMTALVLLDHLLMQDRINKTDQLEMIRQKIDTIDREILLLLAQRFRYITEITGKKRGKGVEGSNKNRQAEVEQNWMAASENLKLDPEMSQNFLTTLLKYSKKKEQELIS